MIIDMILSGLLSILLSVGFITLGIKYMYPSFKSDFSRSIEERLTKYNTENVQIQKEIKNDSNKVQEAKDSVNNYREEIINNLSNLLDDVKENVHVLQSGLTESVDGLKWKNDEQFKQFITEININIEKEVARLKSRLQEKTDDVKSESIDILDDITTSVEKSLSNVQNQLINQFIELKNSNTNLNDKTKDAFKDLQIQTVREIADLRDYVSETTKDFIRDLQTRLSKKDKVLDNVVSKVEGLKDTLISVDKRLKGLDKEIYDSGPLKYGTSIEIIFRNRIKDRYPKEIGKTILFPGEFGPKRSDMKWIIGWSEQEEIKTCFDVKTFPEAGKDKEKLLKAIRKQEKKIIQKYPDCLFYFVVLENWTYNLLNKKLVHYENRDYQRKYILRTCFAELDTLCNVIDMISNTTQINGLNKEKLDADKFQKIIGTIISVTSELKKSNKTNIKSIDILTNLRKYIDKISEIKK